MPLKKICSVFSKLWFAIFVVILLSFPIISIHAQSAAMTSQQQPDILSLLQGIADHFGLNFAGLIGVAAGVMVVVNYFKATSPFNKIVQGNNVPYVVAILSLVANAVTLWGSWLALLIATALTTAIAIGGWATIKTVAHKVGTAPTNASGGK